MKRITSLLLTLLLFLCPLALAEESGFPGVWIENDGYGTLVILADGTARMDYYDGTVTECHWALTDEGAKFTDGMWLNSPMELPEANTLRVADGWMVFTREGFLPVTDPALLLGAEPVGEDGEPFLGGWELTLLIIEGEEVAPSLFGMTMDITFNADGTVVTDDGLVALGLEDEIVCYDVTSGDLLWSLDLVHEAESEDEYESAHAKG